MNQLPRLALATPAVGPEPSSACLAMLAGLTDQRWKVQHFRSWACPTAVEAVGQVTGLPGRHLDAWLMPPQICRRIFAQGAMKAEVALVEGTLEDPPSDAADINHCGRPGGLGPLVELLDLPVVALVSCPRRGEEYHLPKLPDRVDAILLDELEDPADYPSVRCMAKMALRRPVIGAVEALPEVRAALRETAVDRPLPEELIERLGASFMRFADLPTLRGLAESRPFSKPDFEPGPSTCRRFRVAYAQDEAFGAYFPDTLETLEALGAELVEFSPLSDESLPEAVDLVMIGCGFPDLYVDELAENLSLIAALRSHVCRGQRIYSEGGGTAYLGRSMTLEDGRQVLGAGILPFDAVRMPDPPPPSPVSRTLIRDGWLGPKGTTVRGYLSNRWRLIPGVEPIGCPTCFGPMTAEGDFFHHHHAVGGLMHLHLGALPEVVRAFAGPHRPSLTLPSPRP